MAWWNPLSRSEKKAAPARVKKAAPRRAKAASAKKPPATAEKHAGEKKQAAPRAVETPVAKKTARKASERVQLRWIAQARSGDKGDIANIALFAPTEEMYAHFCREVTVARVKKHFGEFVKGKIDRYEVPNVRALNFVARAALGGGAASALRSDPLGKSYGSNLLRMEIDVPVDLLARTPKWQPPNTLPDV